MKKLFILLLTLIFIPFTSALTSGEGTIIFGAIFSLSILVLFFLVLSIIMKNPQMKVFFMSMSFLTVLASVGMGVSVLQEFFSDVVKIVNSYGQFYILLVTLTAGGLFALILWLIITAFKSFYSYKEIIDEEID